MQVEAKVTLAPWPAPQKHRVMHHLPLDGQIISCSKKKKSSLEVGLRELLDNLAKFIILIWVVSN